MDSQAARGRTRDKSKELGHSGEPKAQTRSFQLQQEMVGTSMLILTQLPLGGHGPKSVLARSVLRSTLAIYSRHRFDLHWVQDRLFCVLRVRSQTRHRANRLRPSWVIS